MSQLIERGFTVTLTAFFHDSIGTLTDAVNPEITILDSTGTTVVNLDSPSSHPGVGQYQYTYNVISTAPLGTWNVQWTGTVDGLASEANSTFTVISAAQTPTSYLCAPWAEVSDVRLCCNGLPASGTLPDETIETSIIVASDILYTLSGKQFSGICQQTVRPCSVNSCYSGWWTSWGWGGGTGYESSSTFPNPPDPSAYPPPQCSCGNLPKVDLGLFPVIAATEVKINGAVVDPNTYRVDEKRYLVRLTDPATGINPGWPTCQRLDLPTTEVGTWEVTAQYGTPPPPAGVMAAAKLACEFSKACANIPCQLPARATNINRQQVNITLLDPAALGNGMTGVYEVDLFITAYNPTKSRGHTLVYSPDINVGSWRTG